MTKLRARPEVTSTGRTDLYLEAYIKTCTRLETEMQKGGGLNVERLQRKLQRLYDKIVVELEHEKNREDLENLVSCAIGRAITDRRLPRSLRPKLPHPAVFAARMQRQ